MNILIRHLRIQPHGDRLLSSGARFWLFSVSVLITVMAGTEACSWAFVASLMLDGWMQGVVVSVVGVIVFAVIWMIDVSLVTLDRAWAEHSRTVLGRDVSTRGEALKGTFAFALRIGLMFASLTITAPYLSQLVFHSDIEHYTTAEAADLLEQTRRALAERNAAHVETLTAGMTAQRNKYELEVAGRGASRRYGSGPAAKALRDSLEEIAAHITEAKETHERSMRRFNTLASDWRRNRSLLAAEFHTVLPGSSALQSRKALNALRARPEHAEAELAIKAFLTMIFFGLLLLKTFEPSSVRLYLSEVLQQEYERYWKGTFDAVLPTSEVSARNPQGLSPQRFYAFLSDIWLPARQLERRSAEADARRVAAQQSSDALERTRTQARRDADDARLVVKELRQTAEDVAHSLTQLTSAIETIQRDLQALSADLAAVPQRRDLDELARIEYESHLRIQIAKATKALRELEEALPRESRRQRQAAAELIYAEERLRDNEEEIAMRDREARHLRAIFADAAASRAEAAVRV